MKNLETRKYELIWLIMQLENEAILTQIEHLAAQNSVNEKPHTPYMKAIKPLRKGLTLEELASEQNYKGFSWAKFSQL